MKPVKVYDIAKASRTKDEWCENDETSKSQEHIYVNLNENRESFTAYNGTPIWNAIYRENCMMEQINSQGINPNDQCSEETLLF